MRKIMELKDTVDLINPEVRAEVEGDRLDCVRW